MMSAQEDSRLDCLRAGAAKFFCKPVAPSAMANLWLVRHPSSGEFGQHQQQQQQQQAAGMATPGGGGAGGGRSAAAGAGSITSMESLEEGGLASFDAVSSSRVERLLRERELVRRVRSVAGAEDGLSSPVGTEAGPGSSQGLPLSGASRPPSVESLLSMDRVPEAEPRQRLLVVANRLPVSAKRRPEGGWALEISAGGLVSALLGIQKNYDICWIGWPGEVGRAGGRCVWL